MLFIIKLIQGGIITGTEINPVDMIGGLAILLLIVVVIVIGTGLASH